MEEPSLLQHFPFPENASFVEEVSAHETFLHMDLGFSQAHQKLRNDDGLHIDAPFPSCSSSGSLSCKSLQEVDFQRWSIIPCKEELLGQLQSQMELPKNKVHGEKYSNISEYLVTHFLLLREDCMQTLRQGVQAMLQNKRPPDRLDLQVYKDTRLQCMRCGKFGLEYLFSFRQDRYSMHSIGSSKRLMEGSLVCMSDDGFHSIVWAIVSCKRKVPIDGDCVQLRCLDNVGDGKLDYNRSYTMVESPPAFFEAYSHVLTNLQKPEMMHLPFADHLISLKPQVDAPEYLIKTEGKQDEYDFSCVFPEMEDHLKTCVFPILQEWPQWKSSLDPSQMEAVKHGITKRLAVIQGPPGTGKTFVGKIIVNILLNNLWKPARTLPVWEEDWVLHEPKRMKFDKQELVDGPLLILCYTNHALDQFLEGVFEFEQNIIRYGGRSTSSKLADCSVKQRVKKERRGILRSVWGRHRADCRKSDKLQMEISRCHAIMHLECATFEPLCEVATQEQIEHLFFCGPSSKTVRLWLQGLDMQSALQQIQEEKYRHADSEKPETMSHASGVPHLNASIVSNEELPEELNFEEPYVWMLGISARRALHSEWLKRIKGLAEKKLCELTKQYQALCSRRTDTDEDIQLFVLQGARVIGMTTTAAARCHSILMQLKPKVVIVEEAAEILEAHVIACLTPFTQHLILIGDHLQLRPSVAVNKLATDCDLDVSLFERLVSGGVEHVTLKYQRRMRPCISRLLRSLYPELKDHGSVFGRKNVDGLCNNVFFLDHRSQERHVLESKSKINIEESLFVVELYLYILKQGSYQISDVTILTMYRAQMQCIKNLLQERVENVHSLPTGVAEALSNTSSQITCVDDYQGEESNIIILSLVRNVCAEKDSESIGFLENSNRICVALSRARDGLYIFGNAELLSSKSKLWHAILEDLRQFKAVGRCLTLACPNHFLDETEIHEAKDFERVIDGGCCKKCEHKLDCGHICPKSCHPGDHKQVVCPQRCGRFLPCKHRCMQKCHGMTKCAACVQKVPTWLRHCGHWTLVPCSNQSVSQCEEPCAATLACGHNCTQKCGQECTRWCTRRVDKELPCGHIATIPCCQPASKYFCRELCGQSLEPVCKHRCHGKCTSCRQKRKHPQCCQPCEKVLPCGHQCKSLCYQVCQPCTKPCEYTCRHRRCHRKCGDLCQPCEEPCDWNCEHFKCGQKCHQVCNRPRCNQKCPKVLKCGHDCIGLCGEPCPIRCRICHPNIVEVCSQLPLKEMEASTRFVELSDCGHLGEYNMLDAWVDMDGTAFAQAPSTSWPKFCPKCKTPIRRTVRYRSTINSLLMKLEDSKKLILDRHYWSNTSCN